MGVDVVIDHACPTKERLGVEKIVQSLKAAHQAHAALEMLRENGDQRPPSEIIFHRRLKTAEGIVQEECNLQEVIDEAEELKRQADGCADCPANASGEPFGCWCYVSFPITPSQERWLMDRLPDDLGTTGGVFLDKALLGSNIDGKRVDALRRHGDTFFVGKQPVERHLGGFVSGKAVDSSRLLEAMLFKGTCSASHALMLCLFVGMVPHNVDPAAFKAMLQDPSVRASAIAEPPDEPASALDGVHDFLRALRTAAILNTGLIVDA